MTRALYEIWEEEPVTPIQKYGRLNWRVQLVGNNIGYFPTREDAEKYAGGVKEYREKQEKRK